MKVPVLTCPGSSHIWFLPKSCSPATLSNGSQLYLSKKKICGTYLEFGVGGLFIKCRGFLFFVFF